MKTLIMAMLVATFALVVGCSDGGSKAVNEFLDSYESSVKGFEDMVTSGAMSSDDITVMMKAVNEMNLKNLEMSQKAKALKEEEWSDEQRKRMMILANRFSETMMKMSKQMQK